MERRKTRQVSAGKVKIGGGAPVTVQSMLNVPAGDVAGSVVQAKALAQAGCEVLRAAIPDLAAVRLPDCAGGSRGRRGQDPDQSGQYRRRRPCQGGGGRLPRKRDSDPNRCQFRFP